MVSTQVRSLHGPRAVEVVFFLVFKNLKTANVQILGFFKFIV